MLGGTERLIQSWLLHSCACLAGTQVLSQRQVLSLLQAQAGAHMGDRKNGKACASACYRAELLQVSFTVKTCKSFLTTEIGSKHG